MEVLTETQFIDKLRKVAPAIGDDCAILRFPGARSEMVITTDLFLENVHFQRETHSAADVGHKVVARGLSDIAAMGADPYWYLISVAFPPWADDRWKNQFCRTHVMTARMAGAHLVGGDTAHADQFACDIVMIGKIPVGKSLRRDGARPGDYIYASGQLGGSALGLRTRKGPAWRLHLRPTPRLALGRFLRGKATACMDLSDGLSIDLKRLCMESQVAADLNNYLPEFPKATLEDVLHGGEDYELLFTTRPYRKLPQSHHGVEISRIGVIVDGPPGRITNRGKELEALGYDHFRK